MFWIFFFYLGSVPTLYLHLLFIILLFAKFVLMIVYVSNGCQMAETLDQRKGPCFFKENEGW